MKMITFTTRIIAIALIMLGFVIAINITNAQDRDEFAPTILKKGDIITNEFSTDVNAHLYAFSGRVNDTVNIWMIQPENSTLDPYLVLLGADGAVIASDDDSGPRLFSALIQNAPLPADGTYYNPATTKTGERFDFEGIYTNTRDIPSNLRYELRLEGASVDSDEIELDATELRIGSAIDVEVSKETPVVYATFTARRGDTVTITTANNGQEMDTILYLFDAEGNRLAVNDDGDNMGFFSQINRFSLPEDGMYLIVATSYGFDVAYQARGDWDGAGRFRLSVN